MDKLTFRKFLALNLEEFKLKNHKRLDKKQIYFIDSFANELYEEYEALNND